MWFLMLACCAPQPTLAPSYFVPIPFENNLHRRLQGMYDILNWMSVIGDEEHRSFVAKEQTALIFS
jgi:hypothetical protein